MSDLHRLYDLAGKDGYPPEWHETIKHVVREEAGHRCLRCHHPYPVGIAKTCPRGEWTPCDDRCNHGNPVRWTIPLLEGEWQEGLRPRHGGSDDDPLTGGNVAWAIEEGYSVQARYRILTVHHLDGNKLNCRWWNLCALCQRCHLQIQGKVKMLQTYPFEHSTWFKPYAAGFYAFTYLGEELSRAETIVRLDELLGLERVS